MHAHTTPNTTPLTRRQGARVGSLARLGGTATQSPGYDAAQCVINTRVELLSDVDLEVLQRRQRGHGCPIGAFGSQGVECVGGAENSCPEGDAFARQAARISCSVPTLMVVLDVVQRSLEVKERRQDVESDLDVLLDVLELLGSEPIGLVEDRFANSDLADVVKPAGD